MTLQDIKETKRYGRTDNVKTVYPLQTKFAGGIIIMQRLNIKEWKLFELQIRQTRHPLHISDGKNF